METPGARFTLSETVPHPRLLPISVRVSVQASLADKFPCFPINWQGHILMPYFVTGIALLVPPSPAVEVPEPRFGLQNSHIRHRSALPRP